MNRILLVTLLLSVTLIAKASNSAYENSKNRAVDSGGYCTQQFIQDYNSIVYEKMVFKDLIDGRASNKIKMEQILVIDDTCKQFYTIYNTKMSCKALSDNKEQAISNLDHLSACKVMAESVRMAYGETFEENGL